MNVWPDDIYKKAPAIVAKLDIFIILYNILIGALDRSRTCMYLLRFQLIRSESLY